MNFEDLFKTSWRYFSKNIVDLLVLTLVGCLLCFTIILIPAVVGGWSRAVVALIRDGKKPQMEELWSFDRFGSILLFMILGGLLISIGYMLLFIPGVILNVLFMYTVFFIVDQKMSFGGAMTASKDMVLGAGFFQHLVVWLVVGLIQSVGAAVSGVGVLLTMPFVFVFTAVIYLEQSGRQVNF